MTDGTVALAFSVGLRALTQKSTTIPEGPAELLGEERDMEIFYSGCFKEKGHFIYAPNGLKHYDGNLPADFPVRDYILDGALLPPGLSQVEGKAVLVHLPKWTILTFWDRSLDSRLNSCSSFVCRGFRDFPEMVKLCKEHFPIVWNRFTFDVVHWDI